MKLVEIILSRGRSEGEYGGDESHQGTL
jgi:hypothetical protein